MLAQIGEDPRAFLTDVMRAQFHINSSRANVEIRQALRWYREQLELPFGVDENDDPDTIGDPPTARVPSCIINDDGKDIRNQMSSEVQADDQCLGGPLGSTHRRRWRT